MKTAKCILFLLLGIFSLQPIRLGFAQSNINKIFHVRGVCIIDSSVNNTTFKCDSTSKILVIGKNIVIENCVFDANNNSVDRSLIECLCDNIVFKNCIIENIQGREGKGAYGIYIDIENCKSTIQSCKFKNITDSREETDPVGKMKGMCGAIFYSCSKNYLMSTPQYQYVENVEIENVYTSLPSGEINDKSIDADGIRIFINERKSPKAYSDAQKYVIKNVTGRDVQKRLIKISGATNCTISNVIYDNNRKLSRRYPSHLIAIYDSDNVQISNVDYTSGCNDIAICGSKSSHITINNVKVKGNGNVIRKTTSSLFRISNCSRLSIKDLKFSGQYYRLGQLSNSEDIEIELYGKNISCMSPIEIKDTKKISLSGNLQSINKVKSTVFKLEKVEDISIDKGLGDVNNTRCFVMKDCSGVSVR